MRNFFTWSKLYDLPPKLDNFQKQRGNNVNFRQPVSNELLKSYRRLCWHIFCYLFWYWSITMQCWHSARVSTESWCASHGCYECYAVWRIHRIILWMHKKATVKVKCTIGQNIYPKTMRPCPIAAGNIEHNSEKWLFWVFQVQWLHYNTGEVDKRQTAHVKFPPDFL